MRTITAKFNSACAECGKPVLKDSEARYEDADKTIYHPRCEPNASGDMDAESLADRLGFIRRGEPIPESWYLWKLPHGTGSTAERTESPARPDEDSVQRMSEKESA